MAAAQAVQEETEVGAERAGQAAQRLGEVRGRAGGGGEGGHVGGVRRGGAERRAGDHELGESEGSGGGTATNDGPETVASGNGRMERN